jgi:hypothetical protein
MRYPRAPAVVLMHVPADHQERFQDTIADTTNMLLPFYLMSALSLRDAYWHHGINDAWTLNFPRADAWWDLHPLHKFKSRQVRHFDISQQNIIMRLQQLLPCSGAINRFVDQQNEEKPKHFCLTEDPEKN